jgi:hypothetical protein
VASALVAEFLNSLSALAGMSDVTFVEMKRLCRLARQASATPLRGPKPALEIRKCLAKEAIRTWAIDQHSRHWWDVSGHKHGKLFIRGLCKRRSEDLLKLSRHQL